MLVPFVSAFLQAQQLPPSPPPGSQQRSTSQQLVPARPSPSELRTMIGARMNDDESIVLDGRLDEAVWARAVPAGSFIQQDPNNGEPATEQTEVRIVYSKDALYLGVTCYDSEPDRLLGYQRRRDEQLPADDRFMWMIDTYLDARTGYYFEMNPSGQMGDELQGVSSRNRQWDGIWTGRARTSDTGWTLEVEIPFRILNFNRDSDTWGINFQRTVRRKNEESVWMGWPRNQGLRRRPRENSTRLQCPRTARTDLLLVDRVEFGGAGRGHVPDEALPRHRRNAVQFLAVAGEQRAVRHTERGPGLAVTVPVDTQAGE
jgi:hypothetical protein